jgi:hypothetical protein
MLFILENNEKSNMAKNNPTSSRAGSFETKNLEIKI